MRNHERVEQSQLSLAARRELWHRLWSLLLRPVDDEGQVMKNTAEDQSAASGEGHDDATVAQRSSS